MATAKTPLERLAEPFPADEIELLPKFTGKKVDGKIPRDAYKSCSECGGYHPFPCIHLSYIGHAGITMRLNEVDPDWSWEPMGFTPQGTPAMADGGLWIRLTVLGKTIPAFGDAQDKKGPNATKEMIGDAIRNGAMRFGVGTYLWSKSEKAKAMLIRGIEGATDDEPTDAERYAAMMKRADAGGTKDAVKAALGAPKTAEAALKAFTLMSEVEKRRAEAIADGTVES